MWPFAGRGDEFTIAVRALREATSGVVIIGDAGVGKTRLADEVRTRLDADTFHVVRAVASQASSEMPFGALSHVLPVVDADEFGLAANPLGWAADAVRSGDNGRPTVLCVDDAHHLDSATAALVASMVRARQACLIATARSDAPLSEAVSTLWKDQIVQRLDLVPLGHTDVAAMLEGALGGPVSAATTHRLTRLSGGNPLYLRELVASGHAEQRLRKVNGVWEWFGTPTIAPRLRELVEMRVGTLDDEQRSVLELVAFGEPIGVDLLGRMGPDHVVEALEAKQLIEVVTDGRRLDARLAHPLYGEAVRAACPSSRARRRKRQLAEVVEATGARRREDDLRVSLWRLDAGLHAEPVPLITACHLAWAAQDLPLALRFGRAACDAGGGAAAAAALSLVLHSIEDYDEAEAIAAEAPAPGDERDHALQAAARATNLVWGLGQEQQAEAVLDAAEANVRTPVWRQQITVARAVLALLRADLEATVSIVANVRRIGTPTPRVAAELAAVESLALGHLGRTREATDVASTALASASSWRAQAPYAEIALVLSQYLAHIFAGEVLPAEQVVVAAHDSAIDADGWAIVIALFSALRGQAKRVRGQPADGMRWCRESESGAAKKGAVTGFCLAELAMCAAHAGEPTTARDALEQARQRTPRVARMLDITNKIAEPWVRAAEGDLVGALTGLLDVARWLRRRGLPTIEAQVLHDVVRLGGARRIGARLEQLAEVVDGDFVALAARHSRAYVARDGEELERIAAEFAGLGMLLHAAEVAVHAQHAYQLAGLPHSAQMASTLAWSLVERCDGAGTPALRELRAPGLTAREWEVALLAANDLSSKAIADRLVVSPRTVDNHLRAIYAKLGISRRTDLRRVIRP